MRIANNIPALKNLNSLNKNSKTLQKSILKLSTGLRINSASDDAAGLAISEKMRSQLSGFDSALRNSQDGISLLQTAEGALTEINAMLQKMRELSVQASNDSLTSNDRLYIQLEIDELRTQIDKISDQTKFNHKKLLNGESGALWSSDDLSVKARINSGTVREGNYRLEITAEPGQPQVQKSSIMSITHEEEILITESVPIFSFEPIPRDITEININTITNSSGEGWSFQDGVLTLSGDGNYHITGNGTATTNRIKVNAGVNADVYVSNLNIDVSKIDGASAFTMDDAKVKLYLDGVNTFRSGYHKAGLEATHGSDLTITSISGDGSTDGELNAYGGAHGSGIGGSCDMYPAAESSGGNITIIGGTVKAYGGSEGAGIGGGKGRDAGNITICAGKVEAYGGSQAAGIGSSYNMVDEAATVITITGGQINAYGLNGGSGIGGGRNTGAGLIRIREGLIDSTVFAVAVNPGNPPAQDIGAGNGNAGTYLSYDPNSMQIPGVEYVDVKISKKAIVPAELGDLISDLPQTITIFQGDGRKADVTFYETDTVYDAAEKINDAIANSLGQKIYTNNSENFCTISNGTLNTSESIRVNEDVYVKNYARDSNGYLMLDENNEPIELTEPVKSNMQTANAAIIIRSAIPGKSGELIFAGNDEFLRTLGLNTIQEASESKFTASVYDAHTGQAISTSAKSEGPEFFSLIPPDIDIEVDMMAGLSANWDDNTKRFIMARKENYTAMLHLKNNGTIFQIGAENGENFPVSLGSVSSYAMSLTKVNVMTRETASRSIGTLDRAISKISSQRAKIGAYANSLEGTISRLTLQSSNLTQAQSRIKDADTSSTMLEFVKLQIINQAGTSMLAQANQMPNSVLNLMNLA